MERCRARGHWIMRSCKQSEESGAFADSWTEAIEVGAQGKRTSVSCKSDHGPGRPEPWWSSDEELMVRYGQTSHRSF